MTMVGLGAPQSEAPQRVSVGFGCRWNHILGPHEQGPTEQQKRGQTVDGTSAGGGKDDMKMTIPRYILCLVESDRQALAKFTRSPSFLAVLLEVGGKVARLQV